MELNKKTKKKRCYTSGEEGTRDCECISEGNYSADNLIFSSAAQYYKITTS